MSQNIEQSVKDRLKNIARDSGKDFNFICIQYLQERFLARLAQSVYRDHFILKGALLLLAYKIPAVRPSKDIDFLGEMEFNLIRRRSIWNKSLMVQNTEDSESKYRPRSAGIGIGFNWISDLATR